MRYIHEPFFLREHACLHDQIYKEGFFYSIEVFEMFGNTINLKEINLYVKIYIINKILPL